MARHARYESGRPLINDMRHPQYVLNQENWEKWRLAYLGGNRFLKRYLKKMSRREDDQDFRDRAMISYVPAFAKSAINEVKNSIFQRMTDILREGGPDSYVSATAGEVGGVDRLGSNMNTFMGRDVLPELLTMARVGIYVDMPWLRPNSTLIEKGPARPYLYWYKAEDIRSWAFAQGQTGDPTEFTALLLRDSTYDIDQHWVLPYEVTTRYRYLWIDPEDGFVNCQFFTQDGEDILPEGPDNGTIIKLGIRRIPFIMLELGDSLLADVADYQISHMNLASSDISFALKSNVPFYTEQVDMRSQLPYAKQPNTIGTTQTTVDPTTASVIVAQEKSVEVRFGGAYGRKYPIGTEAPKFIAPPSDPMRVSMEKQEQMKAEIRQLVFLAVSNITTQRQSAASKDADNATLEAGLSYIGIELQHAERKIAEFWAMYEGTKDVATVNYPDNYSLLSESDRQEQAKALKDLMPMVNSITFRREVSKRLVKILLGTKVRRNTLQAIYNEIDTDPVVLGDPAVIEMDVQNGIVDPETASLARGYPPGTAAKAKAAQAEKLALIAEHQAKPNLPGQGNGDPAARGVKEASADPKAADKEKELSQGPRPTDTTPTDRTRGKGK